MTKRTSFYTNWQGNTDDAPVWISTPTLPSTDLNSNLTYDLSPHCTGFREINPFEVLSVVPLDPGYFTNGVNLGLTSANPAGDYAIIVRAYSPSGAFTDSPVFGHTVTAIPFEPPVWNTTPSPESVPEGGSLSYDLTQDCSGFRATDPFELIDITPTGPNHQVIGNIFGGNSLAPEGEYTFTVRAYSEEGLTADVVFTHRLTAEEISPDIPVPVAASYTPMSYEFYDDFSNGNIVNARNESYYWTNTYSPPEGTISETGGSAVLTTGALFGDGNKPYLRSYLDYRNNIFCGPVEYIYDDIDLSNDGGAASDRRADLYLTPTNASTDGDEFFFSPSGVAIRLQDNSGGTRIWVGSKENTPNSNVNYDLTDAQPGFYVKKVRVIHSMTGYFLEVFGPAGSDYAFYRGKHELTDATLWGRRGDSYHSIQVSHTAADPATENTLTVGEVTVRSMLLSDVVSASSALDPGYAPNYYDEANDRTDGTVAVVDLAGEDVRQFEASGSGADRHHGVGTPVSRHHSPFTRPLDGSSIMGYAEPDASNTDATCAMYTGWASDPDLYAADSCLVAVIKANGAVSVYTKMSAPNSIPTILSSETVVAGAIGTKLQAHYDGYTLWSINSDGSLTQRASGNHGINPKDWGAPDAGENSNAHCSVVHGVWREADNANAAIANVSTILERRETPIWQADSVIGPGGDAMPMEVPWIDPAQKISGGGRIEHGIISDARPPFNMDRTGVGSTAEEISAARMHANDFCREWALAKVTPAGTTVKIAKQEQHIQSLWLRLSRLTDGNFDNALSPNYDMPIYVSGGLGDRPVMEVEANTPDFANVNLPQSPVYLWHRGRLGNRDEWDTQANDGMGCTLRDMEYIVRAGNPGANGPSWRGAQACSIRRVKVTLEDGINCFEGFPGSGGEIMDCEGVGGVRGLNGDLNIRLYDGTVDTKGADGAQPSPVVAGCIWSGQSDCGIFWGSQTSVSIVGNEFYVSGTARPVKTANQSFATGAERCQVSMIDCYVEFEEQLDSNRLIDASKSVYLENVYVKNPGTELINWLSQATANGSTPISTPITPPPSGQVLRIIRFAQGITGPTSSSVQNRNPVVIDGTVSGGAAAEHFGWTESANFEYVDESEIPADLRTRWLPDREVHFEDPNLTWPTVTQRQREGLDPFDLNTFAAANNHRIALPKGFFNITQTYEPPAQDGYFVSMRPFGRLHNRQQDGDFSSGLAPLYRTADDATGNALMREVTFWSSNGNTEHIHNRSGLFVGDSPWIEERNYVGWSGTSSPSLSRTDRHLIKFEGVNAGGFLCSIDNGRDFSQSDNHRKIIFTGCRQPIRGFGWNVEHTRTGGGAVEIHDCGVVIAAGFKAEGCFRLIMVRDNVDGKIKLYGFGGNMALFPFDQNPNNYLTASPGTPPTDAPYTGTTDSGTSPTFSYYPAAGANTPTHLRSGAVGFIGDNPNVLVAQTQLIARVDDTNPNWNNVYGLKFRGDRFHVITDENGSGTTYLSECTQNGDANDDRPVLYIKGNPD